MIENANELLVSLHQFSRLADMLEALRLDGEQRKDYRQFAHLSQSYLSRIRALNNDIRAYLKEQPDVSQVAGTS